MRIIALNTWPRRKHFEAFRTFDYPHFGLCANVDVTVLYALAKERRQSFTIATTYALARAANDIPEFRYRIRDEQVVEHELVHPSITVLTPDDLFSFCTLRYVHHFSQFAVTAEATMEHMLANPTLEDEPGQDNLLFMTSVPWVTFTSVQHPIHMHPVDSVPRIAWGKFFSENEHLKMPLSVQAHHALMDGVHVGRYYIRVQELLDRPQEWLCAMQNDTTIRYKG